MREGREKVVAVLRTAGGLAVTAGALLSVKPRLLDSLKLSPTSIYLGTL